MGGARATYFVSTGADSGPGSLRQAIQLANMTPGLDTIAFDFPFGSSTTLSMTSAPLPPITDPVVIDGWSQPGYSGVPLITLEGWTLKAWGIPGNGLTIRADACLVRGLAILNFPGNGIEIRKGNGNVIVGNQIGVRPGGSIAEPNNENGVVIRRASYNVIGGTESDLHNVISGNLLNGVLLVDDCDRQTVGNVILGISSAQTTRGGFRSAMAATACRFLEAAAIRSLGFGWRAQFHPELSVSLECGRVGDGDPGAI